MIAYNFSLDKLSSSMSRNRDRGTRAFKYCTPVIGCVVFGYLLLTFSQDDIKSLLCYLLTSGNDYTNDPTVGRSAWCELYQFQITWLRNQLFAAILPLQLFSYNAGFYLFAVCSSTFRPQRILGSISSNNGREL